MEDFSKISLNLTSLYTVLDYFEAIYADFKDFEQIKEKIYNFLDEIKLEFFHKIILGLALLESFDEQLNTIGIDLIKENLKDITDEQMTSYSKAYESPFPISGIYKYKKHPNFIILFAEIAVSIPDTVSFTTIYCTLVNIKIVYPYTDASMPPNWSSRQFIGLLLLLHRSMSERTLKIIRCGIITYPDLIFLGILQQPRIQIVDSPRKILHELLIYYVKTEKSSMEILKYAWNASEHSEQLQALILQSMQEYFSQNFTDINVRLNRILDIAHSLNAVPNLLSAQSLAFVVEVGIMACKRNYIQIHAWMPEKLSELKEPFLQALYSYLQKHYSNLLLNEITLPSEVDRIRDNSVILDELIPFVYHNRSLLGLDMARRVEELFGKYRTIFESTSTPRFQHDRAKIEQAAQIVTMLLGFINSCRSYTEKIPDIDDSIKEMISQKNTESQRLALFYVIEVITNVNYYAYINDNDLHSISCLISRLLEFNYIDVNRVLDLLDNLFCNFPTFSKYFYMAITILSCSFNILGSSQILCSKWFNSTFFNSLPSFVKYCIEYVHHVGYVPLTDDGRIAFEDPNEAGSKMSDYISELVNRYDIEIIVLNSKNEIYMLARITLQEYTSTEPDKPTSLPAIIRLMNNLTDENVKTISDQLFILLDNYEWFSYHLVRERVVSQTNLHLVYRKLLKIIDSEHLFTMVRSQTDGYIREILSVLQFDNQLKEREILYCLGSWYGLITVADSKPLMYTEINIKHILIECNFKGQDDISRIFPFVKNFISTMKDNPIYNAYNPWLLAILSVLTEINNRSDIRSILKFEIEALVRYMGGSVKNIPPSVYRNIPETIERMRKYLPWTSKEISIILFKLVLDTNKKKLKYDSIDLSSNDFIIQSLSLQKCPCEFSQPISLAFVNIIESVISLIVEKLNNIVSSMVESVITEDFKADPDDKRLIYSSRAMATSVSLSYAGILIKNIHFDEICKRMRSVINATVEQEMENLNIKIEKEKVNEFIFDISNDNIDFIFAYIIKSCTEKIAPTIDKILTTEIECRKAISEKCPFNPRPSLINTSMDIPKTSVVIPNSQQMSVYHKFNEYIPGYSNSNCQNLEVSNKQEEKTIFNEISCENKAFVYSILQYSCAKIYKVISKCQNETTYKSVIQLLNTIAALVSENNISLLYNVIKHSICCYFEFIVRQKFSDDPKYPLLIDNFIDVLLLLRDSKIIIKQQIFTLVTQIVLEFPAEKRNNVEAISSLLSKRILCLKSMDNKIHNDYIVDKIENVVDFAVKLSRTLLVDEYNRGVATEFELCHSLDIFNQVVIRHIASEIDGSVSSDIPEPTLPNNSTMDESNKTDSNNSFNIEKIIREWVRMYYTKSDLNIYTNFKIYIALLVQFNVFDNDDSLFLFVKTSFQIIVKLSSQTHDTNNLLRTYQIVDSFIHFVVLMTKFYGAPECILNSSKMNFFTKVLNFIYTLFLNDITNTVEPSQLSIYERIVTGLILEISRPDTLINNIRNNFIVSILGFLHSLSPEKYLCFAQSFLCIISNSILILVSLNEGPMTKSASLYCVLLCDFVSFLSPSIYVNVKEIPSITSSFFNELTKLFLTLSTTYPDVISYYYINFMNVIPHCCFQLRNIVLSAIPTGVSSKFDCDKIVESPLVFLFLPRHIPISLIKYTESYLSEREPDNYKSVLLSYLENEFRFEQESYGSGVELLNAFVFHMGASGSKEIIFKKMPVNMDSVKATIHYDILYYITTTLNSCARFIALTAIANNIRFLSNHSKFFIFTILSMFLSTQDEHLKEQIARTLFERV
ncbi:hypothetical protein HZS_6108, partial [Henneguya salminicola]